MEDYSKKARGYLLELEPCEASFGPLVGVNRSFFLDYFPWMKDQLVEMEAFVDPFNELLARLPDNLDAYRHLSPTVHLHAAERTEAPTKEEPGIHTLVVPSGGQDPGNTPFTLEVLSLRDSIDPQLNLALFWIHRDELLKKAEERFTKNLEEYQRSLRYLFSSISGSDWGVGRSTLPTLTWDTQNPMAVRTFKALFYPIRERLKGKGRTGSTPKSKISSALSSVESHYESLYSALRSGQSIHRLVQAVLSASELDGKLNKRIDDFIGREWVGDILAQTKRPALNPVDFRKHYDPIKHAVDTHEQQLAELRLQEESDRRVQEAQDARDAAALVQQQAKTRKQTRIAIGVFGVVLLGSAINISVPVIRDYLEIRGATRDLEEHNEGASDDEAAAGDPPPVNKDILDGMLHKRGPIDLSQLDEHERAEIKDLARQAIGHYLELPTYQAAIEQDGQFKQLLSAAKRQANESYRYLERNIFLRSFSYDVERKPNSDMGILILSGHFVNEQNSDPEIVIQLGEMEFNYPTDAPVWWKSLTNEYAAFHVRDSIYDGIEYAISAERYRELTEDPSYFRSLATEAREGLDRQLKPAGAEVVEISNFGFVGGWSDTPTLRFDVTSKHTATGEHHSERLIISLEFPNTSQTAFPGYSHMNAPDGRRAKTVVDTVVKRIIEAHLNHGPYYNPWRLEADLEMNIETTLDTLFRSPSVHAFDGWRVHAVTSWIKDDDSNPTRKTMTVNLWFSQNVGGGRWNFYSGGYELGYQINDADQVEFITYPNENSSVPNSTVEYMTSPAGRRGVEELLFHSLSQTETESFAPPPPFGTSPYHAATFQFLTAFNLGMGTEVGLEIRNNPQVRGVEVGAKGAFDLLMDVKFRLRDKSDSFDVEYRIPMGPPESGNRPAFNLPTGEEAQTLAHKVIHDPNHQMEPKFSQHMRASVHAMRTRGEFPEGVPPMEGNEEAYDDLSTTAHFWLKDNLSFFGITLQGQAECERTERSGNLHLNCGADLVEPNGTVTGFRGIGIDFWLKPDEL
jgi:hypothetical protein